MEWKKIIKIAGFVALAVAFGFGIYFVFFRKPAEPRAPGTEANLPPLPTGSLPGARTTTPGARSPERVSTVARGGLTLAQIVIANPVVDPVIAPGGGGALYYDRGDGRFYRVNSDGTRTLLSDKRFFNVETVAWNHTRDAAVLEYPDGSNIMANFRTNTQTTLPRHWTEFIFSSDANKIVAKSLGTSEENQFLVMADADGSNVRVIETLGTNASRVQVAPAPGGTIVAFARTGGAQGFGTEEVLFIGLQNENLKSLVVDGLNFAGAWSPGGRRLLGSSSDKNDDFKPRLFVTEASSSGVSPSKITINLNTWVDKCTFQNDEVAYCAVPRNMPAGAGIAREAVENLPDVFYRVNLVTGATGFVAEPQEPMTARDLLVAEDGSVLYFTDQSSGQLKKINLR